jgi:hypothetical protein
MLSPASLPLALFAAAAPASAQLPFTEEALARGVDFTTVAETTFGKGVAAVDLDGDGDPELVALGGAGGVVGLFENLGAGTFVDHSNTGRVPNILRASGLSAADYDRDGDLDLFVSAWPGDNVLLRNDGGLSFTDVTLAAGVADDYHGSSSAWADVDGDGWVDLYAANYTPSFTPLPPSTLFRNNGDGTFADEGAARGVEVAQHVFQPVFLDFDRDGDADLYLSIDKCIGAGMRNRLYENVGGQFVDVSAASATDICICSMGVGLGDLDQNGFADLYCTNLPAGNPLLLNLGGGVFVDATAASGAGSSGLGWGATFFDYDNDGFLDLFVVNAGSANELFEYDGAFPCTDRAAQLALADAGDSYCNAVADLDGDGDLDLVLQTNSARLRVLINHEGELRSSARFDVQPRLDRATVVGATADARVGASWQHASVRAGTGFKSQDERVLHFGLGAAGAIDELVVTWPDGATRTLTDVPAGARWTLWRPERLGDVDGDGVRGLTDVPSLLAAYDSAGPVPLTPGLEAFDFDGDSDLDHSDLVAFLGAYEEPLHDCNANGTADLFDLILGNSLDLDGNGIPDECPCGATSECQTSPNSAGPGATLSALGGASLAANDLTLLGAGLPAGALAHVVSGQQAGVAPLGSGLRCIAGSVLRLPGVLSADAAGALQVPLDMEAAPLGGLVTAGSTWRFQLWYRDGAALNTSDALAVVFCP